MRDLLLENLWKIRILIAVKVSAECNEKFSISVLPETVRWLFREPGLHRRSARRRIVSAKNSKLRLSFAKSILNKPETF